VKGKCAEGEKEGRGGGRIDHGERFLINFTSFTGRARMLSRSEGVEKGGEEKKVKVIPGTWSKTTTTPAYRTNLLVNEVQR